MRAAQATYDGITLYFWIAKDGLVYDRKTEVGRVWKRGSRWFNTVTEAAYPTQKMAAWDLVAEHYNQRDRDAQVAAGTMQAIVRERLESEE